MPKLTSELTSESSRIATACDFQAHDVFFRESFVYFDFESTNAMLTMYTINLLIIHPMHGVYEHNGTLILLNDNMWHQ